MPQLKSQVIIDGYLKHEFEVKVFEPGEPLPAYLRDSAIRLADEEQPEIFKPGERQFVTGVIAVYYNKNMGEGEPEWVNLNTIDIPQSVRESKEQRILIDQQKNEIRALKGTVTRLKKEQA